MFVSRDDLAGMLVVVAFVCLTGCEGAPGREEEPRAAIAKRADEDATDPLSPGGKILVASHEEYRRLTSYQGVVEVSGETYYPADIFRTSRRYQIAYVAPDRLRFDGQDGNGDPEWIVSNGTEFREDPRSATVGPTHNAREALDKHMGISLRASVYLPAFLLGIDWTSKEFKFHPGGDFLPAFAADAQFEGTVIVDGHECDEVKCIRDVQTWVFAVDKKNHLIRQLTELVSTDQMKVVRRRGGGGITGRVQGYKTIHKFRIDSINEPLDPELFQVN